MAHNGPFLIEFIVEPEENVYPMVVPGASLAEVLEEPRKQPLKDLAKLSVSNM